MLHSSPCCNQANYELLARYFQPQLSLDARRDLEGKLVQACTQASGPWPEKPAAPRQFLARDDQCVTARQVGELRVLLAGSQEYDELICAVGLSGPFTDYELRCAVDETMALR